MRHADVHSLAVDQLNDSDAVRDGVLSLGHHFDNGTRALGWSHDKMLVEKVVLEHMAEFVATSADGAWALGWVGDEGVLAVLIEAGQIDATGHEDGARDLSNSLERSLNSIEDCLKNTYRTQSIYN